ncbi:LysR substrate-binding domain-containing protein [Bosea lathyri]|uniref:DNA-binding transcriptional regulator, LysR family n=1 Tax=Bosea lathyri TaxID=1036778 RepID=A0A1H6CV07_9HYPH|nr:LysR substrate-binding domain-containing protein [Bosea lathyri]SEG76804.1 DNA-binding transcriptional regulator, LysR family [Bosea lathyri]
MPTISPRQVSAFRAVMLTGGITRAASMIHLTQPAVSRLIKEFELTTGLKLFERTGSGITPTREANVIFAEVERLFTGLDRIMELAIELRQEPVQSIRIAAFPGIANGFLPRMVAKLIARAPGCTPSINSVHSEEVVEWVASDKCDLGLAGTIPEHPLVSVVALESIPFVVALPRNHPLAAKHFLEPRDFARQAYISISQTVMNLRLSAMFAAHEVSPHIVAQSAQATVGCAMVSAGLGMAIVDPFAAEDAKAHGVEIRPLRPSIPFEFAYVLPANRVQFSIVAETMKLLQEEVATLRSSQEP